MSNRNRKKGLKGSKGLNVENRYIKRKFDVNKKQYTYGSDDKLPQELIEVLFSSKNAVKGMRKRARYMAAYGFSEPSQNKLDVGNGKSALKLLKAITTQQSIFGGRAYLVMRKGDGTIGGVEEMEFELCRHRGDYIGYNPTFGRTDYSKDKEVKHPIFMGNTITTAQLTKMIKDYDGRSEIFYRFSKDAFSYQFPVPDWFSGEFTVRTDAELDLMAYEQANNAMITSGMLVTYGDDDDQNPGDDGLTASEALDNDLRQFTGRTKDEQGVSNRYKMLRISVGDKAQAPDFIALQNEKVMDSSITFRDAIGRDAIRLFDVNPVLCGYSDASVLGNQQALSNASMELANSVESEQNDIEEDFSILFGGTWQLTKFMPISFIPDKVWEKLTDDEIRAIGGYKPLDKPLNNQV